MKSHQFKDYLLAHRASLWLSLLFVTMTVAVHLSIAVIPQEIIDRLEQGRLDMKGLALLGALLIGLSLIGAVLSMYMRRFPLGLGISVMRDIRRDMFHHLTELDDAYYRAERTGDIMTRMTSDITTIRESTGHTLLQVSRTVIALIIAFSVMFYKNAKVATVMLLMLPVLSIVGFLMLRKLRDRYEKSQDHFSTMSNFFQESFAGIRPIKGSGSEARQQERFDVLNSEYVDKNLAVARLECPLWPMMGMMFTLGFMFILLVGGPEVIAGRMTLGELVLFQQYLLYLQWPMLALGWTLNLVQKGRASWSRIRKILDSDAEVFDGEQANPALVELQGDIEFRHVSLSMGEQKVLKDISLVVPEGKTVGITGPTGCGKTLLTGLLVRRFDPSEGQVFIGVHDLREYTLENLRSEVRIAAQEPFLFSDTLANNIIYGGPAVDHETMLWAAELSQLRDEAEDFPNGFQTLLGERGVTLSGGQKQRTSIARAVVSNPQILILDDTLSAVDTQTESGILGRLRPLMSERTSLITSHRISTLREADFIVVLQDGRITQQGTHEELIEQSGYYQELDITQRLEARLEAME